MSSNPFQPQGNSFGNQHNQSRDFGTQHSGSQTPGMQNSPPAQSSQYGTHMNASTPTATATTAPAQTAPAQRAQPAQSEPTTKLAMELNKFNKLADNLRETIRRAPTFELRCQQAFDVANDLFGNAPTWICFYRALLGGSGMIHNIFTDHDEFGRFLRTDQYHQIQQMLTALRSRDLPENDPNDPQRMITVRLPKSLHEAMCDEAGRLNISVNRLCISRMLQLLDPAMIPETKSKPRGRKPRNRKPAATTTEAAATTQPQQPQATPQQQPPSATTSYNFRSGS